GLEPGDKVALVLPTCEEFFFALFGALALGAVPVPLYPTLGPELTARIFRDAEARAVVTIDWFRATVEEAKAEAPDLAHYLPPDLRNPRTWLEAITAHRAGYTVSPDFGYRNCLRNVHDTAGLDLSSLRMAMSGAEPVRLSTIRAFQARFGLGDVFAPAYG